MNIFPLASILEQPAHLRANGSPICYYAHILSANLLQQMEDIGFPAGIFTNNISFQPNSFKKLVSGIRILRNNFLWYYRKLLLVRIDLIHLLIHSPRVMILSGAMNTINFLHTIWKIIQVFSGNQDVIVV